MILREEQFNELAESMTEGMAILRMEALSQYRHVIVSILTDLAEASMRADVETLPLFDTDHNNYLLIDAGWDGIRRIHHVVAHLRIHNGKIWVEADNTDAAIVQRLLDAGVPKGAIVLGFYSAQKRPLTEFAAA